MEVASIGRVRGRVIHDFVSSSVAVPQPSQAAQASRPSGQPTRSFYSAAQALKKSKTISKYYIAFWGLGACRVIGRVIGRVMSHMHCFFLHLCKRTSENMMPMSMVMPN